MFKRAGMLISGVILAAGLAANAAAADTIRVGWTAWSDAEFVTKLVARLLEDRFGYEVELIQTDIAPQYQGVATGSLDLMLMSWQPDTHADYIEKTATGVANLGVLYTHARLGWVVPRYIPESEIGSISDLGKDDVKDKLDETVTGIDPGAGLSRLSQETLEAYGLDDYRLQLSSGAGMTAALERAIRRKEWIVVTGWSPHWMFGAYELRYLEDPKGSLGGYERVHALARKGFYGEHTDAAAFISRINIPLKDVEAAMYHARETSYEEAVTRYIEDHERRIDYWVTGEL